MLGRNSYTKEELDHGRTAIDHQLSVYKTLVGELSGESTALADFEAVFFNNLTLVLDRYYVHRVRAVAGKDGNQLNEVEMITDSVMNNDGVLKAHTVLKYVPEQAVVQLKVGDRIRLSLDDFERLSSAFFAELERRFVEP
jgi:hypothetical protein